MSKTIKNVGSPSPFVQDYNVRNTSQPPKLEVCNATGSRCPRIIYTVLKKCYIYKINNAYNQDTCNIMLNVYPTYSFSFMKISLFVLVWRDIIENRRKPVFHLWRKKRLKPAMHKLSLN